MSKHHHHHEKDHRCPHDREEFIDRLVDSCYGYDCGCGPCKPHCKPERKFTKAEACEIARVLGVNIDSPCFDIDQFLMGLNVELEHGTIHPSTNITDNDPIMTGKIALAHLNEIPDYYTRLARMRREAREYWNRVRRSI